MRRKRIIGEPLVHSRLSAAASAPYELLSLEGLCQ